jgi:hypothetical protein
MKKLRSFLVIGMGIVSGLMSLHAMEPLVEEHFFLKSSISDIQDEARDLSEETGFEYQIVAESAILEKCLEILGLNYHSTPLDIRYHYELMKQKLLHHDGLHNVITKAYNQLMNMLASINNYKAEIEYLLTMSFEDVQAMELENKDESMYDLFFRRINRSIDATIAWLENKHRQDIVSSQISDQFGLPVILQTVLKLPADASPHMVDEHYYNYIQKNDLNRLIALERMKNISTQKLRNKLDEIEKVKKAYERYVQKREQG